MVITEVLKKVFELRSGQDFLESFRPSFKL